MIDKQLISVVSSCVMLEKSAQKIYARFSENTRSKTLKAFWQELSEDEKRHITYWERLRELAARQELPNIFDNAPHIAAELEKLKKKVAVIEAHAERIVDTTSAFLAAYHLEFYLLHPAFAALFHLMQRHSGTASPEDEYEKHLEKFIKVMRTLDQVTPEFEFFAEFVQQMWHANRRLAAEIGGIKTLQGLIPMCTSCKRVVKYTGEWEEIEYFVNRQLDASITHWICPECMHKLYAEHFPLTKNPLSH